MKYIKTYEKTIFYQRDKDQKFDIGDYVIVEYCSVNFEPKLKKYIQNNPGKIYRIWPNDSSFGNKKCTYEIQYKNAPKKIKEYLSVDERFKHTVLKYSFTDNQLRLATAEEIEMIEIKKNAKKYNI